MGRRTRRGVTVLGLVLLWGLGSGGAAARAQDARAQNVRDLMELSGLNAQIAQIPSAAIAQVQQRRAQLPPDLADWLSAAMIEAFNAERLRSWVETSVLANYDAAAAEESLAWLRSPLGARLTKLEIEAGQADVQPKLMQYAQGLNANPPSEARIDLLVRMIRATDSLEAGIEAIVILTEPMIHSINAMSAPEARATPEAIAATLHQIRGRLREPLANQVMLRSLYTYREVADPDLERYVVFLESDSGQSLSSSFNVGQLGVMEAAGDTLAKRLEELREQREQPPES